MSSNSRSEGLPGEEGYGGWWPDPFLDNVPIDVPNGAAQAIWVGVHVPPTAAPGRYAGPITIQPLNAPPLTVELAVKVWDFSLPEQWHFRNLLSWHDEWASKFYGSAWTPSLEKKFIDFLVDHRVNVASMYEGDEPYATPERLIELGRRGQNLLMVTALPPEARLKPALRQELEQRLRKTVPALREAGLLDRAVAYGWDERGPQWYGEIRAGAEIVSGFGLPLLMAGVDPSYGLTSPLSGLRNAIYCPLMSRYDPELAARARERGNQVWWYETHWTIDQPLIRSRLIP